MWWSSTSSSTRTKNRASTFFEKGMVAHIAFGDPVCLSLREYLLAAAAQTEANVHDGGTYVCMEGPAFSTSESNLYRSWGARVIGHDQPAGGQAGT